MVGLARKILRARFLQADIGISGCNIAVAETGTMVVLTNEGNGRLTATLPPVHIVLLGYEKLLPKFKDIAPIVNALPKSATGQVITSYITMISGPAETMEAGGTRNRIVPKELHVILLDNGRLQMLKDPVFKEAGRCIRCASCLNVCPVYQLLSGQVYGFIYSGGIGSLLTAFLNSRKEAEKIEALCLNCGHCREVCPAKIDIPGLTLQMRAQLRRDFPPPFLQRFITGKIVPAKRVFHTSLRAAAPVSRLISSPAEDGNPYIKRLPFGLKHMVNWRFLPALAGKPFRDIFKTMRQDIAAPRRGRIAFYAGCLVDYVYPEIGESIVHVLNREGFEVFFPEQTCCGAPAFYTGLPRAAGKSTRRNLESLAAGNFDYIVTPCPTCTVRLRRYGDETAGTDPLVKTQAEAVAVKTFDFIELLHKLKKQPGGEPKAKAGEKIKITYHYSCHLKRSSGIFREPRELLSAIRGIEWVEMEEADRCCGFAGTYSMKFPEISSELLKRKIKKIVASGAKLVVVDCPGCLLSLRGGLESQNIPVRACHSASLFRSLKI
jgi:Fe-S oxidoreductase